MKKITSILFTFCLAGMAFAVEAPWLTSLPDAADQARNENKLLLLDFTGSDWCGWCQKLDAETFSRAEFIDYASNNLVLVQVDFPMHKSQSSDLQKANRALKKKYDVEGYPTVLIIKPDGTILWQQTGYLPGGPSAMITAANQCRKAAGLGLAVAAPVPAAPAKPVAPVTAAPVPSPAPPPQKPTDEPKLQAIVYSKAHASVVLGGATCEEGDTVCGMRVVKIARDQVTVEYQGQIKVLKMN